MEKAKKSLEALKQELDNNNESFTEKYRIGSIIGHGSFGIVLSCYDHSNNNAYAVKIINKKTCNSSDLNKLRYEAETLSLLSHPNIVKYKHTIETESKIFMIMELIRGGSLRSFMEKRKQMKQEINDLEASTIMKSILNAVFYMHKNNIVHRDLKPDNILIDDLEDFSTIKLTDFGLSVQFGREFMTKQLTESCGTLVFMAPELAFRHPYGLTVDIWSCGIIMYMLLSNNKHPLYDFEDTQEVYLEKLSNPQYEFPETFSKYARDLFIRLTISDPSERYQAEEALQHPWITRKKNVIPQSISEKRKTFYNQIAFVNIISGCLFVNMVLKKLNELPKASFFYRRKIEKAQNINEFEQQKSLSSISPKSPPHELLKEEQKDLIFSLNKVIQENDIEKNPKTISFNPIDDKNKFQINNIKKTMHVKHDSFGGAGRENTITKKSSSPTKNTITIKTDKNNLEYSRTHTSKTFYSPQKKSESSPKKLSNVSLKLNVNATAKTNSMDEKKSPNKNNTKTSPRKK